LQTKDALRLQQFYPESLRINKVLQSKHVISIWLKSQNHSHKCPLCGENMPNYHGTYERVVQDLPILGKTVCLYINAYEYDCENPNCEQKTFVEDFDGFLSRYKRFSTRCEDFIVMLALETSCEGAARICKLMGIKISGDTIIKLLKKRFEQNPPPKCGEVIGIDDGHTERAKPIAPLYVMVQRTILLPFWTTGMGKH
jgi:transposase